jgi:hypothetical protein
MKIFNVIEPGYTRLRGVHFIRDARAFDDSPDEAVRESLHEERAEE